MSQSPSKPVGSCLDERSTPASPLVSKYIRWRSVAHLDALSIHFIVLFGFRPIQPRIAFLVDQQIWPIDFLEFQFDRGDELSGDKGGSLGT